jgi:nanoRNase/pAp phosphatase (c-di-AMP/oligoRNAs hydrolase)
LKDLVNSSKNILILLPETVCFDLVCAAYALALSLLNKGHKATLACATDIPDKFSQIINLPDIPVVKSIAKSEVILSLNLKKGAVESVRWRETSDKIEFIITPGKGDFEYNDVDLGTTGGTFDLFITLGCTKLESLGTIFASNPDAFSNIKLVNIDTNPQNNRFGTVQVVRDSKSLSTLILDLVEENSWEITKEAVRIIFQGILWANEGFRQDQDLERVIRKLISKKDNLVDAVSAMFDSISVAELRYLGKIVSNIKVFSDDLIVSKIPANEIQGVSLDRILYPEINVVSRVKNQRAVIVLSEYEPGKIQARIYSKKMDLFRLFSDLSPIGNSGRVIFNLEGSLDEVETKLLTRFESKGTPDPQKVSAAKELPEKKAPTNSEIIKEPLKKANGLPQAIPAPPITPIQPQTGTFPSQIPTQPLQPNQWR